MISAIGNSGSTTIVDRTFSFDGPILYQRLGALLAQRGFDVRETEPPDVDATAGAFRGSLRGVRDVVLDASKRRIGKGMAIVGAAMTVVTLSLMVTGVDSRWLLEWLLTIEVLGGGYGLMLIKNPPDLRRTTLVVSLTGKANGAHVLAREGTGKVENDVVFEWLEGSPLLITEADVEALTLSEAQG